MRSLYHLLPSSHFLLSCSSRAASTTMPHCRTFCATCMHRHDVHLLALSVCYTFWSMAFSMSQTPPLLCCIPATYFILFHASIVLVPIRLPCIQPTPWSTPRSHSVRLYISASPPSYFHPAVPRVVRHPRRRFIIMSRPSLTVHPPAILSCPSPVTKQTRLPFRQTQCATVSLLHSLSVWLSSFAP